MNPRSHEKPKDWQHALDLVAAELNSHVQSEEDIRFFKRLIQDVDSWVETALYDTRQAGYEEGRRDHAGDAW